MSYTRLNPDAGVGTTFAYTGTGTATTSVTTLKDLGTLSGVWIVSASIMKTESNSGDLQCRIYGGGGVNIKEVAAAQQIAAAATVIVMSGVFRLDTYCTVANTPISWFLRGVRVA